MPEKKLKLTKAQYQIATDTHRYKIIVAGRRFGKSTLARLLLYQLASQKPGLYWIVSPTYTQSVQNHWLDLDKETRELGIQASSYKERYIVLHNGSKIELKGADNPDTLRGVKLRGLVIDEIASIRYWDWLWKEVLGATLMDFSAPAVFIGTPKGFNHFYDLYNLGQADSVLYKSWKFTSYDNPHVPKSEIDQKKEDTAEDVFAQEYMADFRKYTGLVYKEFDRSVHVRDFPDFQPIYYMRGADVGYTNPSAVPLIAVDKDGRWYQTHEIYKRGLTIPDLMAELKNLSSISEVTEFEYETMDSAAAGDIAELNQYGYGFIPVVKQSGESNVNYVSYKVKKLADRLRIKKDGKPRYFVHPRCTETIREFEAYSWPEKKQPTAPDSESPEKLNDHMMDALADLNAMYLHYYEDPVEKIGYGKIKGTYVPASLPEDDANDYGVETDYSYIEL